MVLTGENGVTVQVHGETFISKAGITTATFARCRMCRSRTSN